MKNNIDREKEDKIELIISTFQKVEDVLKVNNLDYIKDIDLIKDDLLEAKELIIKGIKNTN